MTMGKQPVAHLETLRSSRDPAMAVFTAQAEEAVIMPASPEMQVVWSAADMAINAIVFGGRDAQETMTKAQARALRDIEKRGQ